MVMETLPSRGMPIILAMGCANPESIVEQEAYPDIFFRATNSDHLIDLKSKFRRICERTGIQRRHMHVTEDILLSNQELCIDSGTSSLQTRQLIARSEVSSLGARAARRAIQEWGHPIDCITHLIMATSNGIRMPGSDVEISKLLGLKPNVQRLLLNQLGCSAGGTALRMARELAMNNSDARILVVCSEVGAFTFRPPNEKHVDRLVGSAVMGDGAAALIVGSIDWKVNHNNNTNNNKESGIFEMHWSSQFLIPDTEEDLAATLGEHGLMYFLSKNVPSLVSSCVADILPGAMQNIPGMSSLRPSELFWAVHPGGRAILDKIEDKLSLGKQHLAATREILANFGNMSSPTVLFVLDRLRRRSEEMNCSTTGEGRQWGVFLSFGPGLTVEMQLLRSVDRDI